MLSDDVVLRALVGLVSGIVATGPMTAAMIAMHRRLPASEQYPLPPGEIVSQLAHASGTASALPKRQRSAATLVAHFGYGGGAGVLYALAERALPGNAVVKGVGFGILLWTASYVGWLPATGVLEPPTQHPPRRTAMMIAAHGVWGATLGVFADLLLDESARLAEARGPDVASS